jgi:LmbE family N-acetylglucosaminyl deacetylase
LFQKKKVAMLPGPHERLLVVSPHCDDAVFSCGSLLSAHPGSIVVTVFAAGPASGEPLTEWDQVSGFHPGDDVMAARRDEDRRALSLLAAHPLWLQFHDSQYRRSPSREDLALNLHLVFQTIRPHAIMVPWGLFHSDHILASDACLALRRHFLEPAWFLYEDAIYRRIPDLLSRRIALLRSRGLYARLASVGPNHSGDRKFDAVSCYRSQLKALTSDGRPGYHDLFARERVWRMVSGPD